MDHKKLLLINVLLLLILGNLNAQIVTDRPDQTESSLTVPKQALQIESGLSATFEGSSPSALLFQLPNNLFRYGIGKKIELRLLNQLEIIKKNNIQSVGISDLAIGTKLQLFKKEGKKTQVAFLTHLIVPSGTKEISNNKIGTTSRISICHAINESVGIGYNLGYNYFGEGIGDLIYTLSLGVGISKNVGIFIEPYGELSNMDDFIINFDTGFTYLVNNNLQLDFSFGTGINQKMNFISLGCSWLFEKD